MTLSSELKTAKAELAEVREFLPDPEDLAGVEDDRRIFHLWEEHFFKQLEELELGSLIPEAREILAGIGPRPFDSSQQNDRPYWICLDAIGNNHPGLSYRIRAATMLAWAALADQAGGDASQWREAAAKDLEAEAKDRQTICDLCGGPLAAWWCYFWSNGGVLKICRSCSTHPAPAPIPDTPGPDVLTF